MIWKYTLLWFGLPLLAILNAVIRDLFYKKALGELPAHQVSTVSLIVLIGIYTWLFSFVWRLQFTCQALIVGLIWVTLTVAFEFIFGHFVMKHSWATLFHDYNIFAGRIWLLIPIWAMLAPFTIFKLQS
jgi:hypothetical protein